MDNSQPDTTAKLSSQKRFLFLCGAARSGTTALATLLNSHPDICLGIERYKNVPPREFGINLFSEDRFFDARAEDTNSRVDTSEEAKAKFLQASWVGDKVPRYYAKYELLFSRFPECKIIYIVRDVFAVAQSWNVRARNPKDRWPENNDYRRAVFEWNNSLEVTLEYRKKYKSQLIIVSYEELFSGNLLVLRRMFGKLGLSPKPVLGAFAGMTKGWGERSTRQLGPDEERAFIDANADMALYQRVKSLAISAEATTMQSKNSEHRAGKIDYL